MAWKGVASYGSAWQGLFELVVVPRIVMAGLGKAGRGKARRGMSVIGKAGQGFYSHERQNK